MRKYLFLTTLSIAALPVIASAHGCIKGASAGAYYAALTIAISLRHKPDTAETDALNGLVHSADGAWSEVRGITHPAASAPRGAH